MRSILLTLMLVPPAVTLVAMFVLRIQFRLFERVVRVIRTPDDIVRLTRLAASQMYASLVLHALLPMSLPVWPLLAWLYGIVFAGVLGWLDLLLYVILPFAAIIAYVFVSGSPADDVKAMSVHPSLRHERDHIVDVWLNRQLPDFGGMKPPVLADAVIRPPVERAVSELEAKTEALDATIRFDKAKWTIDQDAGTIVFDRRDDMHATAPVQIIGTYDTADGTWLWAWDNPSVDKALARDAAVVLEYGRKHNIPALTTRKLSCNEADCWEFTALACKMCDAQGAYRGPSNDTRVFMTFGKIQRAQSGA